MKEIFNENDDNNIKRIGNIELSETEFKLLVKKFKNKFVIESCNFDGTVNFSLSKEAKDFLKKLREKENLK